MSKWKQIKLPIEYEVSTDGNIRKKKSGIISKLDEDRDGYLFARFQIKGVKFKFPIHRLVAIAYLPNPDNKAEVNHKDGNKKNNKLNNLEWTTRAENRAHAYATGLMDGIMGENCTSSKLTKKEVKEIFKKYYSGKYTLSQLGAEYGVHKQTIYGILKGLSWKGTGLKEKYEKKKRK